MTLTRKQVGDLNSMNVAAQKAGLGSTLGGVGVHSVTSAEASASAIYIETPFTDVSGWIMHISRSGSTVTADAKITKASGSVVLVGKGAVTYKPTADDQITYFII